MLTVLPDFAVEIETYAEMFKYIHLVHQKLDSHVNSIIHARKVRQNLCMKLLCQANTGRMDSNPKKIIFTNMALIQLQAIVVAFLSSSFAVTLAWIPKGQVILLISESFSLIYCFHLIFIPQNESVIE